MLGAHVFVMEVVLLFISACSAFVGVAVVSPSTSTLLSRRCCSGRAFHGRQLFGSSSFFQQKPGESDTDFFKRIQQAASDPVAFERMALGKDENSETAKRIEKERQQEVKDSSNATKSGGYQRVEDWDEEVKAKAERGEFTWEEKVSSMNAFAGFDNHHLFFSWAFL